jgi:sulfur-carrier protein
MQVISRMSGSREKHPIPEVWYNGSMKVSVKLFASLRTFGPDDQVIEVPDHATIDDVIRYLKIPSTIRLLRIVNGEHRPPDHELKDGDELALFPPIAGG